MSESIKYMHIGKFVDEGFLQEANRLFFHPRGLALEVRFTDADTTIMRVRDYREYPEGPEFGKVGIDTLKAMRVDEEALRHDAARGLKWGNNIEPVPR